MRRWSSLILTAAVIGGAAYYEWNAGRILTAARDAESRERYLTAAVAYRAVVEKYPFSFRLVDARLGLQRTMAVVEAIPSSGAPQTSLLESAFGSALSPHRVDQLALVTLPACSMVLLIMAVSLWPTRRLASLASVVLAMLGSLALAVFMAAWHLAEALEPLEVQDLLGAFPMLPYYAAWSAIAFALVSCLLRRPGES